MVVCSLICRCLISLAPHCCKRSTRPPICLLKENWYEISRSNCSGGIGGDVQQRSSAVDRGCIDYLHRAVGPVFVSAARVQKSQRDRGQGGGGGYWPGDRHGPPGRGRRAVCTRPGGGRKSGGRRLCRQALRGH